MKKKNIFILIVSILIWLTLFFWFNLLGKKNIDKKLDDEIILHNWNDENNKLLITDKNIDISKEINPNNYKWVKEFLEYFSVWTWIILNVDLLNEDFFINTYSEEWYTVIKFDKELIDEIDKSNNKNIKNQAIIDIYNSYKRNKIIYWKPTEDRSWIRLLKYNELSYWSQLHNSILDPYRWESFIEMKNRLKNKKNKTKEDWHKLSYIYDFEWDYERSLKIKQKKWIKQINYKISWRVFNNWKILSWALVEVLNYKDIYTYTNNDWEYILEFNTYPLTRLRLRASFNWLSDWYNWVHIIYNFDNQFKNNLNFNLHIADTVKIIKYNELDKEKIVKSSLWNEFIFKKWVLLDKNWMIYTWDFKVYIYEFNRNTPWMENFLRLDNFDNLYWYTWNMMITNWMTYLMVTDLDWNELYISKNNPIVTRQYYDLKYSLNNKIKWTDILTNSQVDLILDMSKKWWYPIDNIFLTNRKISWFAPWWVLNVKKWIWENNWIRLLNKDWLKEALYYNID